MDFCFSQTHVRRILPSLNGAPVYCIGYFWPQRDDALATSLPLATESDFLAVMLFGLSSLRRNCKALHERSQGTKYKTPCHRSSLKPALCQVATQRESCIAPSHSTSNSSPLPCGRAMGSSECTCCRADRDVCTAGGVEKLVWPAESVFLPLLQLQPHGAMMLR